MAFDIVALTETWLSNQEQRNKSVINQCEAKSYIIYHVPRSSGQKSGGVGILLSNRIKLVKILVHVNTSISSFESIEVVITVVAMSSSQCVNRRRACIVVNRDNYSEYYMCVHVWQVTVLRSFRGIISNYPIKQLCTPNAFV